MFEYIKGQLCELLPAYAIVETGGIGYNINISVNTFSALKQGSECKLYVHEIIRDDAHLLFGFTTVQERDLFRMLLSVSGVGANTARLILSSVSPDNLVAAIVSEDVALLKSVKGVGQKTAQRLVIELRDKISSINTENCDFFAASNNTLQKDALNALVMLGFGKPAVEKVLSKILKDNPNMSLEDLIKVSLNYL